MPPVGYRLWPLLAHSVLIQATTFLLRPAGSYQALAIQAPASLLGLIGAGFALVPVLLALPVGRLVNRLGERRLMLAGSLVTVAASLVFLFGSGSITGLLLANAILGAGHLGCVISHQTLVANGSAASRLDTMFGYYTFSASLGQAVGPLLISTLAGSAVQPETARMFLAGTVMSAALVLLAGFTVPAAADHGRSLAFGEDAGRITHLLRTHGLLRALATSAVIVSAVDLIVVYLPAFGAEQGLSAGLVGVLLTVRALFSMASRVLLGRMSSAFGRTRLMVASILVSAGALGAVTIPMPVWGLFIVLAAMGLGLGIGQPLTISWLIEQTPPRQRGVALSLRLGGNRIGQLSVPSVMGLLAAGLGAAGVLTATALAVASTLLLLRGVRLEPNE
ncbi:MAG TPA: MFS transporter [Propionibacteriaceae bacterium]|nr:MFS transporter [Propionibacteriaceae bacterium]